MFMVHSATTVRWPHPHDDDLRMAGVDPEKLPPRSVRRPSARRADAAELGLPARRRYAG
jgi:hypothetical protein